MPLVNEILAPFSSNPAIEGYKNHVYRVIEFCTELADLDEHESEKITIAACFHDLGIYSDNTFDYLPPSIGLARSYLQQTGRVDWIDEIAAMIDLHHRLRRITGPSSHLAEIFRKADLIDFSLGIATCGLPRSTVSEVRGKFPNNGFHRNLARVACGWIARHPLRPVPVLKW